MNTTFLNLHFAPPVLEDKPLIDGIFRRYPPELALYTVSTLLSWQHAFSYGYRFDGKDLLLFSVTVNGEKQLLQPVGDFRAMGEEIVLRGIRQSHLPVRISGVSHSFVLQYRDFCSHFTIALDPSMANYLYLASSLSSLSGKYYEKKRNLVSQARRLYRFEVIRLHPDYIQARLPELMGLADPGSEESIGLGQEMIALKYALEHFKALHLEGIAIETEGHPVALSIFEPLNPATAVIHFEKGDRRYKGIYQLVNQEAAKIISEAGYRYINREEDMGILSLRRAKMSYAPIAVLSSYVLTSR